MLGEFVDFDSQLIYLDGNSLGRLPVGALDEVREVLEKQWGGELVEGWEHWLTMPQDIGDLLAAHLLGAPPGSVVVADSTTVNLYKLAAAALRARPARKKIITDGGNFPTNRYVLEGLCEATGASIEWLDADPVLGPQPEDIAKRIGSDTA